MVYNQLLYTETRERYLKDSVWLCSWRNFLDFSRRHQGKYWCHFHCALTRHFWSLAQEMRSALTHVRILLIFTNLTRRHCIKPFMRWIRCTKKHKLVQGNKSSIHHGLRPLIRGGRYGKNNISRYLKTFLVYMICITIYRFEYIV